jgi:hypothetical protein
MPERGVELNVYGYMVVYRHNRESKWLVDQDDEYLNLPAHYISVDEALDRVEYLRSKGIEGRVAALVAESTDTAEEFEENKANGGQEDSH